MQNKIKPSEVQVSGLQKNYRKFKLSLYEEKKAEVVQDIERQKVVEGTKKAEAV